MDRREAGRETGSEWKEKREPGDVVGRKNRKRARGRDALLKWLIRGMLLGSLAAAVSACGPGYQLEGDAENIQIRTETEPIYNHFPDLPVTSEMHWCSESAEGIGLNTVRVYIFAYYDHDMTSELQGMKFGDHETVVDLRFVPEGISREQKWRIAEDASVAFQEDIKDTRKMNTTVYLNEQGTVLYIEAIGD